MEALKVRNGRRLQDILVTGRIIIKRDLVFSFTKTVTNMKACGQTINAMVKAPIGGMKMES